MYIKTMLLSLLIGLSAHLQGALRSLSIDSGYSILLGELHHYYLDAPHLRIAVDHSPLTTIPEVILGHGLEVLQLTSDDTRESYHLNMITLSSGVGYVFAHRPWYASQLMLGVEGSQFATYKDNAKIITKAPDGWTFGVFTEGTQGFSISEHFGVAFYLRVRFPEIMVKNFVGEFGGRLVYTF